MTFVSFFSSRSTYVTLVGGYTDCCCFKKTWIDGFILSFFHGGRTHTFFFLVTTTTTTLDDDDDESVTAEFFSFGLSCQSCPDVLAS